MRQASILRATKRVAAALLIGACVMCALPVHAAWIARPEPGLSTMPLVGEPQALALAANARLAAVALRDAKAVAFVDPDNGVVLSQVALARKPSALVLNAAGTCAYVLFDDSNQLAVIDVSGRRISATWTVGSSPSSLSLDPLESQLVVADSGPSALIALDPGTGKQLRTQRLDFVPSQLTFSGNGIRLLVAGKGLLVSLDAGSWSEIRRVNVGDDIRSLGWWDSGALALAVGKKLDALNVIDVETSLIVQRIALDGDPDVVSVSPSENRAFVSTRQDLSVNRIDLAARALAGRYILPAQAGAVVFDPLTRTLLITQPKDDALVRLDPAQASLISVLTLNKRLLDIAVNNTTHEAIAIADKSNELSRIKLADKSAQTLALPSTPTRVAVDATLNRAVVGLHDKKDQLAFVDLAPSTPALLPERIDLPDDLAALAVDASRNLTIALTKGPTRIHFVSNATRTLLTSLPSTDNLVALAIHSRRGLAYLVSDDKRILLLDLQSRSLTQALSLGFKVDGIAVDEGLDLAVLTTNQGDRAYLLNLATLQVSASFALPRNPAEVAVQPDAHLAVVTSRESNAVSLIDLQNQLAAPAFNTLAKPARLAVSVRYNQALVLSAERDEIAFVQLTNPVPQLNQVVPTQVLTGTPSMSLMLYGAHFIDAAKAMFGTTPLVTRWQSPTVLFADVPASQFATARTVPITVTNPGPGGGTSNAVSFAVMPPPPQINAVSPTSLVANSQAQLITVTGVNFIAGAQIVFGAQALVTQPLSATQLQANVPGNLLVQPGSALVSVITSGGQSNALAVTLESPAPVIQSISPVRGEVGTLITITGRGFYSAPVDNQVAFTNNASASVISASSTQLTVKVPATALTGPVSVTTVRGTGTGPIFTVVREEDFGIVVSPSQARLLQGAKTTASLELSSLGTKQYSGLASLNVSGLPAGVSAKVTPAYLSATQAGSLELAATGAAAPGTYAVTVTGSGLVSGLTQSRTGTFNLVVDAAQGVTGVKGRFVTPDGRGIAGVIVRADTGTVVQPQTTTDVAGNFLLAGLPAGDLTLRFDATPANPLYPIWPYNVTLSSGAVKVIPDWTIQPPPSDDKFTAINNATQDQVVTDPRFPGVEILLPAGVRIVGYDGVPKTRIAIERRDPAHLPVPAPPIPTRSLYQLYFGTPMGGIPTAPIPVALPNEQNLDPGTQTELWYFDGSPMGGTGSWKQAGTGTVSADGKSIVSDIGSGIPRFCGVCGLTCFRGIEDAAPNKPCPDCNENKKPTTDQSPPLPDPDAGFAVTLATGQEANSVTDLVVDGEVPIVIGRTFNPFDAFAYVANYQQSLGVNWTFNYDIALLPFQDGLGSVRVVLPGNRRVDFTRGSDNGYRNSGDLGFDGAEVTRISSSALPPPPAARLSSGASSGSSLSSTPANCAADGSAYVLRFKDGRQWRFDPSYNAMPVRKAGGCLYHVTEMRDSRNRTLNIVRSTEGRPLNISTSTGQSVRIDYNGQVISAITDQLGRRVSYTHEMVPGVGGSLSGFGSLGLGSSNGGGLNTNPPPITPMRLIAASTPEGGYSYTYEDDPLSMRLGNLGVGGGTGTISPQSLALPPSTLDSCQEQRGGTRIVSFTRPGLSGPVQLIYGKSKRVLREIWSDGTTLDFSYQIAGGCTAQGNVLPSNDQRYARCQGDCTNVDSLANANAGFNVLGGTVQATTVTDGRGNSTMQQFNAAGLAAQATDALGQKTLYQRDGQNRITQVTDPQGRTWRYAYDERGNRTQTVDPLGRLTEASFDTNWSKPTVIARTLDDGTPVLWLMHYDPLTGNLLTLTDPLDQTTTFAYDDQARLSSITDPLNHTVRFAYNERNEVIAITDALGNRVTMERDAVGRVTAAVDALGFRSQTHYNGLDQITQLTDALGGLTRLAYDANNHLASVTDPMNHVVESYAYDAVGRLTQKTDAKLKAQTYRYDTAGNLIKATDRKGQLTRFTYDEQNRVVRTDRPDGSVQTRRYDVIGRLARVEEGSFSEEYGYDLTDRLARVITAAGGTSTTIAYDYDSLDRRIRRTINGQEVTQYGYDNANRVTSIVFKQPGKADQTTTYAWDAAGRLTQKTLPNGIRIAYLHDEASRLLQITYTRSDGSLIEQIRYGYDANGNRIAKSTGTASVAETPFTATYDEANRMTQITLQPGSANPKTYTLAYDDSGNLTTKQNLADASDTTIYSWDARDRLSTIQGPGVNASFAYDAYNRRIARTVNGQTTQYVYDGIQAIGEIRGSDKTSLLTGVAIDEMIARYTSQGSRAYLTDALGSVIGQVREDQTVLNWYGYSLYGETTASGQDEGNSSQYTGRENDATGLYYYRARYYDPVLKRFIAEDPIGLAGGSSLYAYVGGDPIRSKDPTGLKWIYSQSSGNLYHVDPQGNTGYVGGNVVATGYAGHDTGLNNPAMQGVANTGPLPRGDYTIEPQQTNVTGTGTELAASMRLTPKPGTNMLGRSGFLIHGGNFTTYSSSRGCIVLRPGIRDIIGNSGDPDLEVIK